MKKTVSFSIIIPVYNAECYLKACLDSVLQQTYQNFEVICVDDGSTDHSSNILDQYSKKNSQIRVFTINNSGPSMARNIGIAHAVGDYILFLDSDDSLSKDCLKLLCSVIGDTSTPDVVVFEADIIAKDEVPAWVIESTTSKNEIYTGDIYKLLPTKKNLVPFIWNKAYKKSFLDDNKITFSNKISLGEDKLFLYDVFIKAKHVRFTTGKLYHYRWQRKDSIMTTFKKDYVKTTENHLEMILSVLDSLIKNHKLEYRIDDTMQWMVSLLYNSSLKELSKENATLIATKFYEYYANNGIDKLVNLNWWDKTNIDALNHILGLVRDDKTYDFTIIMHENQSDNYGHIVDSFLKQDGVNLEIIIVCFSINFYTYIKSKYARKCKIYFFPQESFNFANQFSYKIANGKYVLFASYNRPLKTIHDLSEILLSLQSNNNCVACVSDLSGTPAGVAHINGTCDLSKYAIDISNIVFDRKKLQSRAIKFNYAGGFEEQAFIFNALLGQDVILSHTELQHPYAFYNDFLEEEILNFSHPLDACLHFVFAISRAIIAHNDVILAKSILSYFMTIDWAMDISSKQFILLYPLLCFLQNDPDFIAFYRKVCELIAVCEEHDAHILKEVNEKQQQVNRLRHSNTMRIAKTLQKSIFAKIYRRIKAK